jgi:Tfp pilus assembly protein PilV
MTTNSTTRLLRERLGMIRRDDAGLSIIEVLVAFLIFTLIAIAIGQSMVFSVRLSADQRSRTVALNLAAEEIDRVRGAGNPYLVESNTPSDPAQRIEVDGTEYTVSRTASMVTQTGSDAECGIADQQFQLKRINVEVTWTTRMPMTAPVRSDTLLAPSSTVSRSDVGTIIVQVRKADGTPYRGVSVGVTPTSSGAAVTAPATDSAGCSYVTEVRPGTYNVSISRSGNVDTSHVASPVQSIELEGGSTVATQFAYDARARITASPAVVAGARLPRDLAISLFNSNTHVVSSTNATDVYPWASGYSVVGGRHVSPAVTDPPVAANAGCISPDPAEWRAGTLAVLGLPGTRQAGVRPDPVVTTPGSNPTASYGLGAATLTVPNSSNRRYITAVNTTPALNSGDPGCAIPQTYTWDRFNANQTVTLALPYGTWEFWAGNNFGALTQRVNARAVSNSYTLPLATSTVMLDPRQP